MVATNTKTPNPSNPSALPQRFEIRKLDRSHSEWAGAIVLHSNIFYSPVWAALFPEKSTARLFDGAKHISYLVDHQIDSGLSYGVFDTQYVFKNKESEATGGKLYWDEKEPSVQETQGREAEAERLLRQMDFPLVSVALSYDSINALDPVKLGPILEVLPGFALAYHILEEEDKRNPDDWKATGPGQVLFRNATSTRRDYEAQKVMASTARWLMREAASKGFRAIQIECFHDAVRSVWERAEEPFKGTAVSEFDAKTWRNEEDELEFYPSKQVFSKVYVDLKPAQ
jgi:hypothetical protein